MFFTLTPNGQSRDFANLTSPVTLAQLVDELQLKGDRIAVEHNGQIVERTRWPEQPPGSRGQSRSSPLRRRRRLKHPTPAAIHRDYT